MDDDPFASIIGLLLGFAVVVFACFVAGAKAATRLTGGVLEDASSKMVPALGKILDTPDAPATAWGDGDVPGPVLYWTVTAFVTIGLLVAVWVLWRVLVSSDVRFDSRDRLGSSPEGAMATRKDLAPLHISVPVGDRYTLGKMGRTRLAAENRTSTTNPGPQHGAGLHHVKDRGAVMIIGPSRTGKSVSVITSMLHWTGPIVAVSVKDDLLRPTLAQRRRLGNVATFDPTGSLRQAYERPADRPDAWDDSLLANWSPLQGIGSFDDALAAAQMLTDAAPGNDNGSAAIPQFFVKAAELMLGPMMWLAAMSDRPLGEVVDWVMVRPGSNGQDGRGNYETTQMADLFRTLTGRVAIRPTQHMSVAEQTHVAKIVAELPIVEQTLRSQIEANAKTMDSVYSSVQTMIKPWVSPTIRASATGGTDGFLVDLGWLLEGANTLYMTARPDDFARLTPVYGGAVNDLLGQVYKHFNQHGPIEPPLLVVLDEVGNMPVKKLPEFASLLAGMGVQLVTIWQDIAQIRTAYGQATDTIMSNHLSKVFFGGSSGLETLRYASELAGEEEVHSHSQTTNATGNRKGSFNESPQRASLVPVNVIRQMGAHRALLIHGSLPPAYISTLPFYNQRDLESAGVWSPRDHNAAAIRQEVSRKATTLRQTSGLPSPLRRRSVVIAPASARPVRQPVGMAEQSLVDEVSQAREVS